MFAKAVEWYMMEQNPFNKGKSLLLKVNNMRIRYLTEEEIPRLMDMCKRNKHLYHIVVCALNTGLRRGDILNLKWEQIRNGFIYPDRDTETRKRREIPVNEELENLFKEIRKEQELTSKYVFTYHKKVIKKVDRAFKGALVKAGIEKAYVCQPFDYEGCINKRGTGAPGAQDNDHDFAICTPESGA